VRLFGTKALGLDEKLPEAYMLIADVKLSYDWDFKGAEECFKRALELNPNHALAHSFYSNYLATQGRFDEAIREAKIGRSLDPLSPTAVALVASAYLWKAQYDSVLVFANEALAIDKTHSFANRLLSATGIARGMFEETIAIQQEMISRGDSTSLDLLALTYALSGEKAKARELIAEVTKLSEKRYIAPDYFVWTFCALGDTARAFECLEKGYEMRSSYTMYLDTVQPAVCDFLLSDPRFHAILKKMALKE
jgi:adenylate cyclase